MRLSFTNNLFTLFLIIFIFAIFLPQKTLAGGSLIWATTSDPSAGADFPKNIAIDSNYMYVVGADDVLTNYRWRIEKRRLSDGFLEWATTSNPSAGVDIAYGIAIDSQYMYVVGYQQDASAATLWRIEKRSLATGSLIWATTSKPSNGNRAYGIAIDSNYMYVVGYDSIPGNSEWRIEKRRLSDGGLEWATTSNSSNVAYGIAIDSQYMYVVGYDDIYGNHEWRIEKRRLSDGFLEWAKTSNPSSFNDTAYGIAIDSQYMYVVGYDEISGNSEWRIEKRRLSDGFLEWAKTSNPSSFNDTAYGIAIDSQYMYVVGSEWHIEKRDLLNGNLIWATTSNPTSLTDPAYDIAIDSQYMYVVGGAYDTSRWYIEKRSLLDNFLDCGLRFYNGFQTIVVTCEYPAQSPLRIFKSGNIYGIVLVDPTDPNASKIRISTSNGIKALRKYP